MASIFFPIDDIYPSVGIFAWPWRVFVMALLIALFVFLLMLGITRKSLITITFALATLGTLAVFFFILLSLSW